MNDLYNRILLGALILVNVVSLVAMMFVTHLFQEITPIDSGFAAMMGFADLIALASQISLPKAAALFPAGAIFKKAQ